MGEEIDCKEAEGNFSGVMEKLDIMIAMIVTQLHIFLKTYQIVHLKLVNLLYVN